MQGAWRHVVRRRLLRLAGFLLRPLASRARHEPPRLLLVRPDHLGDVLLTSPAVALIESALPHAQLTYLVGPWGAEVARGGVERAAVRTLAFPGFTRVPKDNPLSPYVLLFREGLRLRREGYDAAVVFRPDHWWGALLSAVAGIPIRVGSAHPDVAPLVTHAEPERADEHATERAMALASRCIEALDASGTLVLDAPSAGSPHPRPLPLGEGENAPRREQGGDGVQVREGATGPSEGEGDQPRSAGERAGGQAASPSWQHSGTPFELARDVVPGHASPPPPFRAGSGSQAASPDVGTGGTGLWPRFRVSVQAERTAERLLLERRLEAQRMVAIHPSAGSPLKSWPLRQWAAVADALVEQGLRVLLTGGPGDMSLLEQIRNEVRLEAAVLADQPLGVMAAVFERCAVVVGPDNGPLHLAWSRGVPTVRLYGPASPAVYGPWPPHPSQRVLITNALPCVPCGNLVDPPCGARQNPPCLRDITVEAVLEAVRAATRERTAWSLS